MFVLVPGLDRFAALEVDEPENRNSLTTNLGAHSGGAARLGNLQHPDMPRWPVRG
jgi:hypothetical protein